MLKSILFQTTPRILMGAGVLAQTAAEVKRLKAGRVLIVTDKGLVAAGIVSRLESVLTEAGIRWTRFDEVEPDPRFEIAVRAVEAAKSEKAELVIGIGGGSPLDIAKVCAILATNTQPVSELFGIDMVPEAGLATILIPTTAGTGVTFGGAASTNIVFDATGAMTTPAGDVTVSLALTNGATAPLNLSWDFYNAGVSHGDVTGFSSASGTTFQYQDGYPPGTLRGISVGEDGVVTASYSNGELTPLFQVALVDFPSYDGLTKMGRNLYAESINSGQALPGVVGNGRLGSIAPSSLEMSNVDLAQEFTDMIVTQRGFQASSRTITTSDQMLQELLTLKR